MTVGNQPPFFGEAITTPSSGTGMETLTAPLEFLGPAGKYVELHLLARVEGDTRNDDERRNDSSARKFKVSATLGKSHIFVDTQLPIVSQGNGDSFLTASTELPNLEIDAAGRKYMFSKNQHGEYSYVEFECDATHYKQAHHYFYHGLAQFLDALAYRGNCPLFIQALRIEDVANQIIVVPQVSPYRKREVALGDMKFYSELRPIYAIYREARNSSSNFYKFLCFYKILEGLFSVVRPKLFKRAKALKLRVDQEIKRIPDDPYLILEHKKYVQKSIRNFFESVLTPQFRHGVAHFMLHDGTAMDLSSPHHVENYTYIVYITELCVRIMIDDCENILSKLANAEA